jgi:hypothetical protein
MSEDYGSSAYVSTHMDQMKRTVGAMCLDTPAGPYDETGGYTFAVNPDVSRSYQDALILHAAESYYAGLPQRFPRWIPYRPRSDSYLSDPGIGVPTITVTGSTGAESLHHNSEDSLKHVDERSLRDLSSVVATFLYSLASATDKEIPWLAEIMVNRSDENLTQAAADLLGRMGTAKTGEASGIQLSSGIDHLMYNADRDCELFYPCSDWRRRQSAKAFEAVWTRSSRISAGSRENNLSGCNRRPASGPRNLVRRRRRNRRRRRTQSAPKRGGSS